MRIRADYNDEMEKKMIPGMTRNTMWKFRRCLFALLVPFGLSSCVQSYASAVPQRDLSRIGLMPNVPRPYQMRNWCKDSQQLYKMIFSPQARGPYLPLIKLLRDPRRNVTGFTIPAYATRSERFSAQALTNMGAVWGATLVGRDLSTGRINYVRLLDRFFDPRMDHGVFGNGFDSASPQSTAWYTVFPDITAMAISDRYPAEKTLARMCRDTARSWADAISHFRLPDGHYDFNYTGFNFSTMRPAYNGIWREPNMAAGLAWLEYVAWCRWRDPVFLKSAKACLQFLADLPRDDNPSWEVMTPFGALAAVRINAEMGTHFPVHKMLHWCFSYYRARPSWGVEVGNWDGQDIDGLIGAVNQAPPAAWGKRVRSYMDTKGKVRHRSPWRPWGTGGYAFFLETATQLWALAPVARYDQRYASTLGKWILNAANASRLFYGKFHPPSLQSDPGWPAGESFISYEGLKYRRDNPHQPLIATGDNKTFRDPGYTGYSHQPDATNYALYGGVYMGVLGAIVKKTSIRGILQLNLCSTDTCASSAYPTYMFYNPYSQIKTVRVGVGKAKLNIYNTITGRFIVHDRSGTAAISVPADSAVVVVYTPVKGVVSYRAHQTLVNGRVIDFVHGSSVRS